MGGEGEVRQLVMALAALIVAGCATVHYDKAQELANKQDPDFIKAWNDCILETTPYGWIPDGGITQNGHFRECMAKAGWTHSRPWTVHTIGAYHRAP